MKTTVFAAAAAALALGAGSASAADPIFVGHLVDYTGPTSDVGKPYGQGVADALAWINKSGGIAGQQLKFETVDYSYNAPRAIATYKKWVGTDKAIAVQGWGTAVTEALTIPTIGIGAGAGTDAQVLVWHDLLGLTSGRLPRFVKQYADLRREIVSAIKAFSAEVADGEFPGPEHTYAD
jgi:hypothetical protein